MSVQDVWLCVLSRGIPTNEIHSTAQYVFRRPAFPENPHACPRKLSIYPSTSAALSTLYSCYPSRKSMTTVQCLDRHRSGATGCFKLVKTGTLPTSEGMNKQGCLSISPSSRKMVAIAGLILKICHARMWNLVWEYVNSWVSLDLSPDGKSLNMATSA